MLEIIHNGKAMNLPPDIQISLTIENPLLKQDRIPTPYSLSFELPATRHNLEQFDWPDRMGSYKQTRYVRTIPVDIRFHSITISTGHLKLTSYLDSLKVTFSGIDFIDGIKSKLYEIDFGREVFQGAYWGTIDFFDDRHFAYWYKQWADSALGNTREDFVLAPIGILDQSMPFTEFRSIDIPSEWTSHPNAGTEVLYDAYLYQDAAYVNQYNPWRGSFIIDRDNPNIISIAVSHANVFPLFRVGYIFDRIFGSTVDNNMFIQGELRNLVMPTFYYSKWKERSFDQATDRNNFNMQYPPMVENPRSAWNEDYTSRPYIEYKNYMPDVAANDFIKNLLSLFCFSLFPFRGRLQMRKNSDVLQTEVKHNWTSKLIGDPELLTEPAKLYAYGYSVADDPYIVTQQFTVVATIREMELYPYDLGLDNYYEGRFYVEETGQRFLKRAYDRDVDMLYVSDTVKELIFEYELLDDRLGVDLETNEEKYSVEPIAQPIPTYTGKAYWSTDSRWIDQWTPRLDNVYSFAAPAISIDRKTRPTTIPLVFYKGMRPVPRDNSKSYPYVSIYPDNIDNSNLLWEGEQGLIEKYHKQYKEWVERDKLRLKGTFLLNAIDLHKLDLGNKVHVKGRNFFVDKLQITLRANTIDPAVIELVEA